MKVGGKGGRSKANLNPFPTTPSTTQMEDLFKNIKAF